MKPPKNFYSNLDRRKQGLPEVPEASAADAGKIIKVGEDGSYELGNDENTIIIPNPETTPSATLNTLTIGSTTYKVNEARVTKILGLRFTINNGGAYNANLPVVSLVDIYGNAAVLPVYTMTCDKNIQYGGLTLSGTPGVLNENLPAAFTVIFNAEFNVEDYPYIQFSKTGLFPADSAKNLKIEYTLDNEGWVEIADLVSIDWSATDHVYDLSTGEEVETIPEIPTPTIADAGKVLGVDSNGSWALKNDIQTTIIHGTADNQPAVSTITFDKAINVIVDELVSNISHDCILVARNVNSVGIITDCVYHIDSYQEKTTGTISSPDTFTFHRIVKNYLQSNKIQLEEFTLSGNSTATSVNVDRYDLT